MEAKGRSFGNDLGCAAGERATAEKRSGAAGRPAVRWRPAMPGPAVERLRRQLEARERELWRKIVEERNRVQDEAQSQLESVGDIADRAFVTTIDGGAGCARADENLDGCVVGWSVARIGDDPAGYEGSRTGNHVVDFGDATV